MTGKDFTNEISTHAVRQQSSILLHDDELPWLHIAEKILAGEWANADGSTCKSLLIGLRAIRNPLCLQAVEALKRIHEKSTGMKTEQVNGTKIFNERTN